jgi:hypothetical protein
MRDTNKRHHGNERRTIFRSSCSSEEEQKHREKEKEFERKIRKEGTIGNVAAATEDNT